MVSEVHHSQRSVVVHEPDTGTRTETAQKLEEATGGVAGGATAAGGALYSLGLDGVVAFVGGPTIGSAAGALVSAVNTIFANSTGGTDLVNNNSTVSGSDRLIASAKTKSTARLMPA